MLHVKKAVKQSCTDERSAWDVAVNPPGWKSARTSAFEPRLVSCVCKAEPPISGDGECWSSKREMVTLKGKQNAETAGVVPDSPTGAGGAVVRFLWAQLRWETRSFLKPFVPTEFQRSEFVSSSTISRPFVGLFYRRAAYSHIQFVSLLFFAAALIFNFQIIFVSVWDNITKDMMWILNIFGVPCYSQRTYQDHFGTVLSPINHCFVADYIYLNTWVIRETSARWL